jgi:hypothetical protein
MVDHDVIGRAEFHEEVPTFDVPDDALERAANAESQATTGYIALTLCITARGHSSDTS